MIIARIELEYTGVIFKVHWAVEPEAHSVGVSGARGSHGYVVDDTLGSPSGVQRVGGALRHGVGEIEREFTGAWGLQPLF